jgi:two-component system, OmpR family, sensor histidine kinase QseC
MNSLFRQTLVRRVVLALLLGFPLVWLTLMAVACLQLWRQQQDDGRDFASSPIGIQMRLALNSVEEPAEARAIVAALDRIHRNARQKMKTPGEAVIQLWDREERRLVFSSPAVANDVLHGDPTRRSTQISHGQTFEVFEVDTPRWSVLWARSPIVIPWLLKAMSDSMISNMVIAFPCVLLPAWLAVSRGLRPLQRLSERIAARGPNDMSPVEVDAKYAELKPLVATLDDLLGRLRHEIESEKAFVANAAHELRTPLAVITAQAHVLSKAPTEPERVEAERRLDSTITRASHLIQQLLMLARMEAKEGQESSVIDLAHLVRQQLGPLVPVAMTRNIEIALETPDRLVLLLDLHAMLSILQNLIDNAIRYGRDGGRILVELRRLSGGIALSVTDDGPGIAESDRASIFDRFYRGANRDAALGTGLGLTIVKQAAERMGGEVQLTTGLDGRGCCFTVRIPDAACSTGKNSHWEP